MSAINKEVAIDLSTANFIVMYNDQVVFDDPRLLHIKLTQRRLLLFSILILTSIPFIGEIPYVHLKLPNNPDEVGFCLKASRCNTTVTVNSKISICEQQAINGVIQRF